ncbi:MAG: hypothetical protein WBQ19_13545, partial [Terriglobales bacterium]
MRGFAVLVLVGLFFLLWLGFLPAAAAQSQSSSPTDSTPAKSVPAKHPPAKNTPAKKKPAASTSTRTSTTKKKRKTMSPRVRRVRRAFVASASLRLMAQQLLQDRTPTAYAGVEAYARRHAKEDADAGALAWL